MYMLPMGIIAYVQYFGIITDDHLDSLRFLEQHLNDLGPLLYFRESVSLLRLSGKFDHDEGL